MSSSYGLGRGNALGLFVKPPENGGPGVSGPYRKRRHPPSEAPRWPARSPTQAASASLPEPVLAKPSRNPKGIALAAWGFSRMCLQTRVIDARGPDPHGQLGPLAGGCK